MSTLLVQSNQSPEDFEQNSKATCKDNQDFQAFSAEINNGCASNFSDKTSSSPLSAALSPLSSQAEFIKNATCNDELFVATPLFDSPSVQGLTNTLLEDDLSSLEENPFESSGTFPSFLDYSSNDDDVYLSLISPFLDSDHQKGNLPCLDELGTDATTFTNRHKKYQRSFSLPEGTNTKKQAFQVSASSSDSGSRHTYIDVSKDNFVSTNVQTKLLTKLVLEKNNSSKTNVTSTPPEFLISNNRSDRRKQNTKSATVTSNDILRDLNDSLQEEKSDFEEINAAAKKSIEQGSMTPILKKELQTKLQYERLLRGDTELVLENEKPKKYELRPDEIEKKHRRLVQNRESARRCRLQSRKYEHSLEKVIKQEMKLQAKLHKELDHLKEERDAIRKLLAQHNKKCVLGIK